MVQGEPSEVLLVALGVLVAAVRVMGHPLLEEQHQHPHLDRVTQEVTVQVQRAFQFAAVGVAVLELLEVMEVNRVVERLAMAGMVQSQQLHHLLMLVAGVVQRKALEQLLLLGQVVLVVVLLAKPERAGTLVEVMEPLILAVAVAVVQGMV
jgi:hypothetical protein